MGYSGMEPRCPPADARPAATISGRPPLTTSRGRRFRERESGPRLGEGCSGFGLPGCPRSMGRSSGANDRDGPWRVSTAADWRLGMPGILATPAHPPITAPWTGCGQLPRLSALVLEPDLEVDAVFDDLAVVDDR